MGQESLFEGIVRSLKKNAGWATLIIFSFLLASFIVNRLTPTIYKSESVIRVMTSEGISEKDIAAEMNGVLSKKEVLEEIAKKFDLGEGLLKSQDFARLIPSGSGILTLTVKHNNPALIRELVTAVIQVLSDHFLGYSAEAREFSSKALEKKIEHLEKGITELRQQVIASSVHDEIRNGGEMVELENKIHLLEEKVEDSAKLLQTTPSTVFYYVEEESVSYNFIEKELKEARDKLAELYKTYMDKHPKVIACSNNIKELEHKLSKARTKVKKQKDNPKYLTLKAGIKKDNEQLNKYREELLTRKKLALANFTSSSTEGLTLRISALEELHRKAVIELEESKISKNTNFGRINVLRKDLVPPQVIGFTSLQRDCLALVSGFLMAIFLLYTPAPIKTELVGVSTEALASSIGPQLELSMELEKDGYKQPMPIIAEPAEVILEVPALSAEPLNLPCLVTEEEVLSLKYDERLVSLNEPNSAMLKPYKDLVSNLQISMADSQTRIVISSSAKEGTGKTTMIANVGVLLAQSGYSVLLIDANFRAPSIHRMFGLANAKGLSNLLNCEKTYDIIQRSYVDNLSIISSGIAPESPETALGSAEMIKLLGNLKRRFEIILIDTPSLLDYPEASVIAGQAGAVVFLHREGEPEEYLKASKQILNNARAKIFGYVKI